MTVRKPIESEKITDHLIEKLISKGSLVKEDIKKRLHKKHTHINFRIPCDMLHRVDEHLQERVGISRNGWILEAIQEKLKRIV